MNTQMNNDTVVLQHNCSACDKSGKIYLTKDTNTEYCLDCFRENACGECYNAEECTCKQEDSEDEEEEEQIYCDHCSNQTDAETATECGWVGDEEGEWKCVMCVLIEKTLEEKRHAEIHNANFAKGECCTWCLKFPDYTKRPRK